MITLDEIFAEDRQNPPEDRSLPWEEIQNGMTVVVEPKPHWASDMRTFQLTARAYCYYADWTGNGPGARFFAHPETCGDDVMTKARAMIARAIADGIRKP